MRIYRIIGIDGGWNLVNLDQVILVDFDDKADEIIFDSILHIKVDKRDYDRFRKDILKKIINIQ